MTRKHLPFIGYPALAALAFAAPALMGGSGVVYGAAVLMAIFAVMSYGLDLVVSDLGEVSLGHTIFFAAGSYTTALLATRGGVASSWITLGGSVVVALALAAAIGWVTLRLRHFAFSLVTYAVSVVAMTVAANLSLLGGSDGIRGIPTLDLSLPGLTLTAGTDRELWPFAFALLLLVIYGVARFRQSAIGIAAIMTHLNPRLATMSGIDPARVRLQVFLLSAPVSAAAGWLYAYQRAYVSADVLESYFLIMMLTAVVLIGRRQLLGPAAAVVFILAQEKFFSFGGEVDKIVLGAVLVAILAFLPEGLAGLVRALVRLRQARAAAASTITKLESIK